MWIEAFDQLINLDFCIGVEQYDLNNDHLVIFRALDSASDVVISCENKAQQTNLYELVSKWVRAKVIYKDHIDPMVDLSVVNKQKDDCDD